MRDLSGEVRYLKETYNFLSGASDLSPNNPLVNIRLDELVRNLTKWQNLENAPSLLSLENLKLERDGLPGLCASAECEMEKFWAEHFLSNPKLQDRNLAYFWYYEHYQNLCREEAELADFGSFNQISFLGSGALPLTAYFAARAYPEMKINCVDADPEACDLSRRLIKRLGLDQQITVIQKTALEYQPRPDELVICASLLTGQDALYKKLDQDNVNSILVRDAEGLYQFLYKPATKPGSPYEEVRKTTPNAERINTSLLFKRKMQ